jgi:hypothetical protein
MGLTQFLIRLAGCGMYNDCRGICGQVRIVFID